MAGKGVAKTRTVRQLDPVECGAASLTMILRYHGEQVSLEQMRAETDVTRNGCAAGNLVRAAQARGFECGGFRKTAEELRELDPPCIIWWGANHFVVFEGIHKNTCYINDPDTGRRKLPFEEFEQYYAGVVLTFSPAEERVQRQVSPAVVSLKRAASALKQERLLAAQALIAAVAAGVFSMLAVRLLLQTFPDGNLQMRAWIGICCAAAALICWFARCRQTDRLRDIVEMKRSYGFLQKLFAQPISFYDQRYPSDMIRRLRANDRMSRFIAADLIDGTAAALLCAAGIILLALPAGPGLAYGSVFRILPALIAIAAGIALRLFQRQEMLLEEAEASVRETKLARTVFAGAGRTMTLKETGMTDSFVDKAASFQEEIIRAELSARRKRNLITAARYAVYAACLLLILTPGLEPASPPALLFLITAMFAIVIGTLEAAMSRFFRMLRLEEGMEAVEDIRRGAVLRSADEKEESIDFRKLQGRIRCEAAAFSYQRTGSPLFAPVSIDIPSGSMIAVTGGAGSGKSTFGLMVGGLLEPTQGRILYDGQTLDEIPSRIIHASIAAVGQDPQLFAGTVRDNITMWNPNISRASVQRAAEDACICDVIMAREGGFDYCTGERGSGFSGGEQQRIAIARALAVNPSILILDEAMAGLDDETALSIVRNVRRRGCTCLLITRSRALTGYCDQILTLDRPEQDV